MDFTAPLKALAFGASSLLMLSGAGCSALDSSGRIAADAEGRWALLPIDNLSSTVQAGEQARVLLESSLRSRGVSRLARWKMPEALSLEAILAPDTVQEDALAWAREKGFDYALDGTVNEWQYRGSPDGEAVVGMMLRLRDVDSGEVLWQGTASRTAGGYSNLTRTAYRAVDTLLDELELHAEPVSVRPAFGAAAG